MNPERPGQIISQERLQDTLLRLLEDPQNTSIQAVRSGGAEDGLDSNHNQTAHAVVRSIQTIETSAATVTFSGGAVHDSDSSSETDYSSVDDDGDDDDSESDYTSPHTDRSAGSPAVAGIPAPAAGAVGARADGVIVRPGGAASRAEDGDAANGLGERTRAAEPASSTAATAASPQPARDGHDGDRADQAIPSTSAAVDEMGRGVPRSRSYEEQLAQMRRERFNPFNRRDQVASSPGSSEHPVSNSSDSWTDTSPSWQRRMEEQVATSGGDEVTNAELGLAEDHFSSPEGHFGLSTTEELEMAIRNCKLLILDSAEESDRRKNLVRKLVQLRMKLLEAKEGAAQEPDSEIKQVVGHQFKQKTGKGSKHFCEKCNAVIWGVVQTWYKCTACGFCCHAKCLNLITRTCALQKVEENPSYILTICPEKGLSSQNYRCAECRSEVSYRPGSTEPRQCDYTGAYYCEQCHWNDLCIIPARVMHNWDLESRKVCRASKQFLKLMQKRATLRVQDINPMLFNFVEELNEVKKLREELLIMKRYFLTCQDALKSKLLLQLQSRQHFVESSDMYSLQDLIDVSTDTLLPELVKIHASFAQHIKTDCERCRAKGYICELCDSDEVLFPFDNIAVVCSQCSTVLHRHCYSRRSQKCPKCDRINKRTEIST